MTLAITTPVPFDTWLEYAERDFRLIDTAMDILKEIEDERAKAAARNQASKDRPKPGFGGE